MTPHEIDAIRRLAQIVLDTVKAQKPLGAPPDALYAEMHARGCTPDQFTDILDGLEKLGLLRHHDGLYHHLADLYWSPRR